ncbi:MAG: hypothetical protein NVS2B16_03630 [Chloroflexota bacterium]
MGAHGGVQELLERCKLLCLAENDIGKALPIHRAVRLQNACSEALTNGVNSLGVGSQEGVNDGVGVDPLPRSHFKKHGPHCTFAASDPARQPENE